MVGVFQLPVKTGNFVRVRLTSKYLPGIRTEIPRWTYTSGAPRGGRGPRPGPGVRRCFGCVNPAPMLSTQVKEKGWKTTDSNTPTSGVLTSRRSERWKENHLDVNSVWAKCLCPPKIICRNPTRPPGGSEVWSGFTATSLTPSQAQLTGQLQEHVHKSLSPTECPLCPY